MKKKTEYFYLAAFAILAFAGVWRGVDLSDTTYSLGNYRFMGELTGSFENATFLSILTGAFLTKIFGGSILAMNIVTKLFPLASVIIVYFSLRKKVKPFILFVSGMTALGLCWCPSVILYNYLTYFLLTAACMLLFTAFEGKAEGKDKGKKNVRFFFAGLLLGINLLVRISNAVEVLLIIFVICGFVIKKRKGMLKAIGLCILGYIAGAFTGLAVFFAYAKFSGGNSAEKISSMLEWIKGLLSGTGGSGSSGYSMKLMLMTIFENYRGNMRFAGAAAVVIFAGVLMFLFQPVSSVCSEKKAKVIVNIKKVIFIAAMALLFEYYRRNGVFTFKYMNNGSVFNISVVFIMISLLVFLSAVFLPWMEDHEKLLSVLGMLLILISPLGTNNHLFAVINNMFVIMPAAVCVMAGYLRILKENMALFPSKAFVYLFTGLVAVQALLFGLVYCFRVGDGQTFEVRRFAYGNSIPVLNGLYGPKYERDELCGLADALNRSENVEDGAKLLTWGNIPGFYYILDMPPALPTLWPDLESYPYKEFSKGLNKLADDDTLPVIIMSAEEAEGFGLNGTYSYSAKSVDSGPSMLKRLALMEFMSTNNYICEYSNDGYAYFVPYDLKSMMEDLLNDQF